MHVRDEGAARKHDYWRVRLWLRFLNRRAAHRSLATAAASAGSNAMPAMAGDSAGTPAGGFRAEKDALGPVQVPQDALWGAQTQRSVANFRIAPNERFPKELIRSMGIVKLAAARVNFRNGKLPADRRFFDAVEQAAQEVVSGKHDAQFPLVVWQTGSGTQTNMNTNEVIANRAIQILGGVLGSKSPVHPNDHVNYGQSSNDVFPTAMHIAAAVETTLSLLPALKALGVEFEKCAGSFAGIIKIGRTHLQDATPLLLGQEFSAFEAAVRAGMKRVEASLGGVFELAQGGTAVGTGLNSYVGFDEQFCKEVAEITNLFQFRPAQNKFHALASMTALSQLSGSLASLASDLFKIANDIRLLSSGPRSGLGEISIPANEPGSSIMPGKINPTQCEAMTMVAAEVMGNHQTVIFCNATGQLQLNVMRPVVIWNILRSIRLLTDACNSFRANCVSGITPNQKTITHHLNNSLMLITALNPVLGYDKCAAVALHAHEKGLSLRDAVQELNLMTGEDFDKAVRPEAMLGPKEAGK